MHFSFQMENEWEERSFYATNLGIQSNGTKSTKQDCGSLMPKHHDCNKYFQSASVDAAKSSHSQRTVQPTQLKPNQSD